MKSDASFHIVLMMVTLEYRWKDVVLINKRSVNILNKPSIW